MKNYKQDVKDLLCLFGINYSANSERVLEDIIGERIDYAILRCLILREKNAWLDMDKRQMPQGYRFGALKRMVEKKYASLKNAYDLLEGEFIY